MRRSSDQLIAVLTDLSEGATEVTETPHSALRQSMDLEVCMATELQYTSCSQELEAEELSSGLMAKGLQTSEKGLTASTQVEGACLVVATIMLATKTM